MKILIDDNVCQGHGRCYRVAKWLNYDDEGYVVPRGEEIEVPAGEDAAVEEIVGACPEQAITVID